MPTWTRPTLDEHCQYGRQINALKLGLMGMASALQEHYGKTSQPVQHLMRAMKEVARASCVLDGVAHDENPELPNYVISDLYYGREAERRPEPLHLPLVEQVWAEMEGRPERVTTHCLGRVNPDPKELPMGLRTFVEIFLPYAIRLNWDGTYSILNREYQDLGATIRAPCGQLHGRSYGLQGLTPSRLSRVAVYQARDDEFFKEMWWLYGDACRPWEGAEDERLYFKRLAVLFGARLASPVARVKERLPGEECPGDKGMVACFVESTRGPHLGGERRSKWPHRADVHRVYTEWCHGAGDVLPLEAEPFFERLEELGVEAFDGAAPRLNLQLG